jgi:hypothetical protein
MKTILQALKDEIHYRLSDGFFENRLLSRGLNGCDSCAQDVINSKPFRGAVADCLISLIQAPNLSEGDLSFSLSEKDKIIALANSIYNSIGEYENVTGEPTVYIGG